MCIATKIEVEGTIYGIIKKLVRGPVMAGNAEDISLLSGLHVRSPGNFEIRGLSECNQIC
jgi:hypothetical protein